jgi:hypothetical protein
VQTPSHGASITSRFDAEQVLRGLLACVTGRAPRRGHLSLGGRCRWPYPDGITGTGWRWWCLSAAATIAFDCGRREAAHTGHLCPSRTSFRARTTQRVPARLLGRRALCSPTTSSAVDTHRASIQTPFELVSDLFLRAFEPRLPRRPPSEPCRPILPPMRRRHDEAGVGSLSPRPECPWSRAHGHAAGSRAAADCQSADSQSADSQSADSQDPAGCGAPAARRASAPPGSHQSG